MLSDTQKELLDEFKKGVQQVGNEDERHLDTPHKHGLFETVEKLADLLHEYSDKNEIDPILRAIGAEIAEIPNTEYDNADLLVEKVKKVFATNGTRTNPLRPQQ